jgi:lysyl-tRNA synthetase class 2
MPTTKTIPAEADIRFEHLEAFKQAGIEPYPALSKRTHVLEEARNSPESTTVTITGRLLSRREMGKLTFCHLRDASGTLQVVLSETDVGKDICKFFNKNIDLGDFLQINGTMFVTHKGEISVLIKSYALLSKALLPLPEKWHGLTDTEIRYRKRYLDLIANDEAMRIAKTRSLLVRELRNYFDNHGFFEVETPILQSLYGGALAKPFVTHHNALDIPLYLRVAPELYLKRLIIGGFEKVYEIAKCFRNEGIDQNHNPEFTQIEFYWAYADYTMLMDLVEDLLPKLIESVGLSKKFKTTNGEIDFTPPYPRITMRALIQKYAKLDIEDFPDQKSMYQKALTLKLDNISPGDGRGKLIDDIYKKFARPKIVNPIFVIDHPVELSPLAKRRSDNPAYVERFQLLCVGGNELCNAFSELNDPLDQEKRFQEQTANRAAGDEESMPYDADFITALKHGMPPTAGLGMGIDRLIKLLLNADNLKEVILFPTLRPEMPETP